MCSCIEACLRQQRGRPMQGRRWDIDVFWGSLPSPPLAQAIWFISFLDFCYRVVHVSFTYLLMSDPGPPYGPIFNHFHLTQLINVQVIISRKIHFMQRIVFLFGPTALDEVMNAPHPMIIPFMMYENLFDVYVYVLLWVPRTFQNHLAHLHTKPSTSL